MVSTVSVRADSVQLCTKSTVYQNWATNCKETNQQKKVDTRKDVIQLLHEAKIIDETETLTPFVQHVIQFRLY